MNSGLMDHIMKGTINTEKKKDWGYIIGMMGRNILAIGAIIKFRVLGDILG